eukprot:EG_transcript_58594
MQSALCLSILLTSDLAIVDTLCAVKLNSDSILRLRGCLLHLCHRSFNKGEVRLSSSDKSYKIKKLIYKTRALIFLEQGVCFKDHWLDTHHTMPMPMTICILYH